MKLFPSPASAAPRTPASSPLPAAAASNADAETTEVMASSSMGVVSTALSMLSHHLSRYSLLLPTSSAASSSHSGPSSTAASVAAAAAGLLLSGAFPLFSGTGSASSTAATGPGLLLGLGTTGTPGLVNGVQLIFSRGPSKADSDGTDLVSSESIDTATESAVAPAFPNTGAPSTPTTARPRAASIKHVAMAAYVSALHADAPSVYPPTTQAVPADEDVDRTVPGGALTALHRARLMQSHRALLSQLFLPMLSLPYGEFRQKTIKMARYLRRVYLVADEDEDDTSMPVRLEIPGEGLGVREVNNILRAIRDDLHEGMWRCWKLPRALVFPAWLAARTADARDELLETHTRFYRTSSEEVAASHWDAAYPLTVEDAETGLAVLALKLVPALTPLVRLPSSNRDRKTIRETVDEQWQAWHQRNPAHAPEMVRAWMRVHRFEDRGIVFEAGEIESYLGTV